MDIIAGILESAKNGNRKTRIMFKTDINYKQLQKYLPLLLKRGLMKIENTNKGAVYKTTEKGRDFLRKYEELIRSIQ